MKKNPSLNKRINSVIMNIWQFVADLFVAIFKTIKKILFWIADTLASFFKILWLTFEKIFRAIFLLLKLVLKFIKNIMFAVAALIFATWAFIYFISLSFDLPSSQPFQELRNYWIINTDSFIEEDWKSDFIKEQSNMHEQLRYQGELPEIWLPDEENRIRSKGFAKYLKKNH